MEFSWLNLFLIILISWMCGAVVKKLGYPHVLGELLGGIIFGPPLLKFVHGDAGIVLLGRIGVMMMVLYIGTQINPKDLMKSVGSAVLPTLGGFLVPFVLGFLVITHLFGGSTNAGLLVGTVMGTTALVTMSRFVSDLKLLETKLGQTLMAIALFSIIVVLISFSAIIGIVASGTVNLNAIALVLGKAVAFLVITVLLGIFVYPALGRLYERVDRHPGSTDELTIALLFATGTAFMAEAFGLSFILGSFLAGLFLREDMFDKGTYTGVTLAVRDASLGFLAPIFYVSAGFNISFGVFKNPMLVIMIIVVAFVGKFVGGALSAMATRRSWRESAVMGIGMNARGSIDIIVAGVGLEKHIISQDFYSALIFMIFFANVVVPVLLKAGRDLLIRRGELTPITQAPKDEPVTLAASVPSPTSA